MRNYRSTNTNMLSSREIEIIKLISEEYSIKEIANLLFLGFETVKSHRKNIQTKLDVKNAAGIVRAAFQIGILNANERLNLAS